MVKQYELMMLISGGSTPEQVKTAVAAVEKLAKAKDGKVDSHESLGKKPMAYMIKKQTDAIYLLFTVSLDTLTAQSFERDIRLMDNVLRSLFLIKDIKKVAPKSGTIAEVSTDAKAMVDKKE
ncbi:MAG TPA: 30S ribosomal protein S6 [Patescibacteria group bacterium]|nr:30S ribosomal protein S6 [Patescibacteria group bacterium]